MRNSGIWILLIVGLLFANCAKKPQENTDTPVPATSVPAAAASAGPPVCTTAKIDSGQKGNVAAVARGNYSDIKMIPGTSSPAMAFIDASALVIKFTFWNGSKFVTEIVSGDGPGAFVRLGMLSNGTPIIVWTLGANLKAAIRNGPLSQASATWSSGVIDTGVAPRAAEIAINPLDQVAVGFISDTAVAGRAKFLYCDAPCTSPAGFQTMATNPYIENTNVAAAEVAMGVAWCKASATSYYPAAVYSVTGATRYAVCMNTLGNCLNGSNWTATSIVATANLSSKLIIDSTVVGDTPKVVSLGAAGITPYKMGTTACSSGATAFSAGTVMGTATSGNQWMKLLMDPTGKFHLVANESTTAVRYYNSTSSNIVSTWSAAGAIDTTTLPAAQGGGADIDPDTLGVYATYGQNAAPFDFKMARVNDYAQPSNAAMFSRFTPDSSGNLQLAAAGTQLKQIAMASTSTGIPAVAYVDFSVGAVANAKLKYAQRAGSTAASAWNDQLVPSTINPQFPGLVFDETDHPWLSYFDAGTNRFYLATNSSGDGSGTWSSYEFPATPSGAPIALPAANNTAVGLFKSGGVTHPVMVVIDTNATSKGIKVAVLNKTTRVFSTPVTIDGLTSGALGAAHLSLDFDNSGNLVIAYQDLNVLRARYSYSSDAITWTAANSISSVGHGAGTSIKINPSTSKPAVTYFDQSNNVVYYNPCSVAFAACATGGWSPQQVEGAAGVSALTAATGQLLSTALNFMTNGSAFIFYPRGQANDGNLVLTQNLNGSFINQIAASGANANLTGSPALNFAVAGWNVVSTRNTSGYFTTAFLGPGNQLYSSSCGD